MFGNRLIWATSPLTTLAPTKKEKLPTGLPRVMMETLESVRRKWGSRLGTEIVIHVQVKRGQFG